MTLLKILNIGKKLLILSLKLKVIQLLLNLKKWLC